MTKKRKTLMRSQNDISTKTDTAENKSDEMDSFDST